MNEIIRTESLSNGVRVAFHDRSNRYFGDYHRVCVEVRCCLPLTPPLFAGAADPPAECRQARAVLGEEACHVRILERMGVAGDEVERVRQEIIDGFIRSTLPYLQSPNFPARLIAVELARHRQGRRPHLLRP